jgi:hypothetical protein
MYACMNGTREWNDVRYSSSSSSSSNEEGPGRDDDDI